MLSHIIYFLSFKMIYIVYLGQKRGGGGAGPLGPPSKSATVNLQPNTRGIGPLVGRTSRYRRSIMHVLAVILSITCHFFFICQNIFIRVLWFDREICPLLIHPNIF